MSNAEKRLLEGLEKRRKNGNLRSLKLKSNLVDFCSNDYLGLSGSKVLSANILKAYQLVEEGNGSTGSRLLTGNTPSHLALEQSLAEYFEAPTALLFNSGYTANLALISTVPQRGDTVLYDEQIHACVKEGARLGQARYLSFRHNDLMDLQRKLQATKGIKFVVIESLYSMQGDYPPINDILEVCHENGAELLVDEAHTTGWYGPQGKGLIIDKQLNNTVLGRVHTFGKAFGAFGACVVGSEDLIAYLINFARPFIYTTALPPYCIASISAALEHIKDQPNLAKTLLKRINHYLTIAGDLGLASSFNRDSPIQWIHAGDNREAILMSDKLQRSGFDVRPILSPTVRKGAERLRICIHSFNTEQQIESLLNTIARA